MTEMTARSRDCINNDNGGTIIMKTLSDVANAVLDMENEMESYDTIKSVSVGFEVSEGMFLEYGITIRDILDCTILAVGLWGSGIIHTINWDECRGCNDKSSESLIEFLSKCLEQDGIPADSKIYKIETVDY